MIPSVSKRQIKAARALLGWTQDELAAAAGVGTASVKRLETKGAELVSSGFPIVRRIVSCLEASGIEFTLKSNDDLSVSLRRDLKRPPAQVVL